MNPEEEIKQTYLKACHLTEALQDVFWSLECDPEMRKRLTDTDFDIIKMIDHLYNAITSENTELQGGRRRIEGEKREKGTD